jgi:hypothetical protein
MMVNVRMSASFGRSAIRRVDAWRLGGVLNQWGYRVIFLRARHEKIFGQGRRVVAAMCSCC